ncbi:MAG: glycosyltransferase family 4 protein [Ignavibacteriales bacterium]|nr:glycosyltransferase family 4 protein [Ignavibacteriales bacterium]
MPLLSPRHYPRPPPRGRAHRLGPEAAFPSSDDFRLSGQPDRGECTPRLHSPGRIRGGLFISGGATDRPFGRPDYHQLLPARGFLRARGLKADALTDGVDSNRFRPGEPEPELAREVGCPQSGAPLCVYLGVMSDYQGVDLLLDVARLLRDAGDDSRFLFMGYPEKTYAHESERRGLGAIVRFTGRVGYFDSPRYLRLGSIALAPKLAATEANGKVLTCMASGLPVVAFDLPVNRELLGDSAEWVPTTGDRHEQSRNFAAAVRRPPARPGATRRPGRRRA